MSKRILIAHVSKCGATAEVAEAVGETLRAAGLTVDVRRAQDVKTLDDYDAIILGSAARIGRLLGGAVRFAKKHQAALAQKKVAYFVVCMTMKQDTPQNRETVTGYLAPLRQVCEPISQGMFAGRMTLETMGPVWRFFLRNSKPEDLGDFRNWDAIRAWAREMAATLN
jgi:menaquinone-dependent protoporphyrinogen oxidase